jgi:hypothetical protein
MFPEERLSITFYYLNYMEKPGDSFDCYMVSWDEAYRLGKAVARKIKESGYDPDIVIGVARGGLVPARVVCDFLLKKDLACIKVEHWGIAATLGTAKIKYPLPIDITGKKLLVVDDVVDTGDTYAVLVEYLKEKNPLEVRTAVLQYKTCSAFVPDYWGEKLDKWKWIIYPWAVYEDLVGFIGRVLENPMTNEGTRKQLARRFDIKIPRKELLEMLDDMSNEGKLRKTGNGRKAIWDKNEGI